MAAVLTIGHSNHPIAGFLALLGAHGVTAVADVRSSPYSRFHPHFSQKRLEQALNDRKIEYFFLGAELGARSKDPSCYEGGKVQYRKLAQTECFKAGLERVVQIAQANRLTLLCAEKEPLGCHRTFLVGRALEARGPDVTHIHADGHLEPNAEAMNRLIGMLNLADADLFHSQDDRIARACAIQEQRIAYSDPTMRDAHGKGTRYALSAEGLTEGSNGSRRPTRSDPPGGSGASPRS